MVLANTSTLVEWYVERNSDKKTRAFTHNFTEVRAGRVAKWRRVWLRCTPYGPAGF